MARATGTTDRRGVERDPEVIGQEALVWPTREMARDVRPHGSGARVLAYFAGGGPSDRAAWNHVVGIMPLSRQKRFRAVAIEPCPADSTLDELLPIGGRPGELQEPLDIVCPAAVRHAARAAGVSMSLALGIIVEHSLLVAELGGDATALVTWLDDRAAVRREMPLSNAMTDYARTLVAALNGQLSALAPDDECAAIPSRLLHRVRVAPDMELKSTMLRPALIWELASVRSGRTMTEWALGEVVAARYPVAAVRQEVPATSAAR